MKSTKNKHYKYHLTYNRNLYSPEYNKQLEIKGNFIFEFDEQRDLMFSGKPNMFSDKRFIERDSVNSTYGFRKKKNAIEKSMRLKNYTSEDVVIEINHSKRKKFWGRIIKPEPSMFNFNVDVPKEGIDSFNFIGRDIISKLMINGFIPAYGVNSFYNNNETVDNSIMFVLSGNNKKVLINQKDNKISIAFDEKESFNKDSRCQAIKWIDPDDVVDKLLKDYKEECNDWYESIKYIVEDRYLYL